jgi:hypothetical protein
MMQSQKWSFVLVALLSAGGCGSHGGLSGTATLKGLALPVTVQLSGDAVATAVTDDSGHYSFTGLVDGNYLVSATAPSTSEGTVTAVVVLQGGSAMVPELMLTPLGSATGHVTIGGMPQAGVVVFADGSLSAAVTDESGNYVLGRVEVGSHIVTATQTGYLTGTSDAFNVQYAEAATVADVDLQIGPTGLGEITGTVTLIGQASAASTQVALEGTSYTATTGADGSFHLTGVPSGVYPLSFQNGAFQDIIPQLFVLPTGAGFVINSDGNLFALGSIELPRARRIASGGSNALLSPDGSTLLFTGRDAVQSVPVAGGAVSTLTTTPPSSGYYDQTKYRFAGPNVVILGADGVMKSAPQAGGSAATLATNVYDFFLSPDNGTVYFFSDAVNVFGALTAKLSSVPLGGGTATLLASDVVTFMPPLVSPDGSRVLYFSGNVSTYYQDKPVADLWTVASTGGAATMLINQNQYLHFEPTLGKVFAGTFSNGNLYAFDPTATALGTAILTDKLWASADFPIFSDDRARIVYTNTTSQLRVVGYPVVAASTQVGTDSVGGGATHPVLSPDGNRLYYVSSAYAATPGVAHCASTTSAGAAVIYGTLGSGATLRRSPDGKHVVWVEGSTTLYAAPTTNATCSAGDVHKFNAAISLGYYATQIPDLAFSPDGKSMLGVADVVAGQGTLTLFALDGSSEVALATHVSNQSGTYGFSPDGAHIMFVDDAQVAHVMPAGGGDSTQLLRNVSRLFWVDDTTLVLERTATPAPFTFQDGVYEAKIN